MADTIHGMYREAVANNRNKVALRTGRGGHYTRMTYGELDKWVDAVAAKLVSLGVEQGDIVGILSRNRPEWVIADLAILSSAASSFRSITTLPPSSSATSSATRSMTTLVVGDPLLRTSISTVMGEMPGLEQTLLLDDAAMPRARAGSRPTLRTDSRDDMARRVVAYPSVGGDDVATIVYTSGTTGEPKGVVLTHGNIVSNARALIGQVRHLRGRLDALVPPARAHVRAHVRSLHVPVRGRDHHLRGGTDHRGERRSGRRARPF